MRSIDAGRLCRAAGVALICGVGCGGRAESDSQPAGASYGAPPSTPGSAPAALPPQSQSPSPPRAPSLAPVAVPASSPPAENSADTGGLWKTPVENVLMADCGDCHGPPLTPIQAPPGINFINDIDALVAAGLIVPLDSADSRIVVVMRDGSMPPPASGLPRVTEADIEVVASYIDNPRFWPDLPPPGVVDAGGQAPAAVDAGPDGG